ncbi:protein-(glutamine-N5) methyltransferase, release factor-specific [Polynucleobacter wuianus]|uniref:Release factor glutamine methyltransferase n=1 Tax=Polynucleobacter wuianus TaxID=1743168 RepID=A0A191UCY3_9BURK|nr:MULTISPECIES: peptide chain release factor N(5)-glutamine methyltransferase [Polynucleobacter]ANI98755.1 protein-(glutamine-N5) methyltransferase, release factor-specific [Polynucleobacter wuianus]MBU3553318.1 peptide chain release factor N(5)-glutamine methyltransferase [Polynucleobacter sp. MWH-Post4-6-1]
MSKDLSLRSLLGSTLLPPSEARILMAHVLDKHYQLPRSALLSRDDMQLNDGALENWRSLVSKRLQGHPIAYLIGKRGFHNIELQVAPGVLIPRPETELLVEIGLREIKRIQKEVTAPNVLDLGTGSGAIALAVAHEAPTALLTATDQSFEALAIAQANAQHLGLNSRIQLLQGSWYEALADKALFDVILSNPPYIAIQDPHLSQGDLRFEPISALTDHASGFTCLEVIIKGALNHLKPMGLIAVEHGFDQSEAVGELMKSAGLQNIRVHQDLSGHFRVTSAMSV